MLYAYPPLPDPPSVAAELSLRVNPLCIQMDIRIAHNYCDMHDCIQNFRWNLLQSAYGMPE